MPSVCMSVCSPVNTITLQKINGSNRARRKSYERTHCFGFVYPKLHIKNRKFQFIAKKMRDTEKRLIKES